MVDNKGKSAVSDNVKGNIRLGKYLIKTLLTVVPLDVVMGFVIALVLRLDFLKSVAMMGCFLIAGIIIGILAVLKNYNKFLKPISVMEHGIIKVAQGDLTQKFEIDKKSEIVELGQAFNHMLESFNGIIRKIHDMTKSWVISSEELSASSEEVTASNTSVADYTGQLASEARNQAETLQQMKIMVTELAKAAHIIAERAASVSGEAVNSEQSSQEGLSKLSVIVSTMEETNESVNKSAHTIEELAEQSNRIGTITETIAQVARQTNLLALNAAIEAARAGEHGKGFAVVADEIHKLAEDVASSTRQVAEITTLIQNSVNDAVQEMEQTDAKVKESVTSIHEALNALDIIAGSTKVVSADISDIAASSEQALASMDEMIHYVDTVLNIAKKTAESAENIEESTKEVSSTMQVVAAAAQNLALNANQLQQEVERFEID